MRAQILVAGWPFAGLLALDPGRAELSGAAPVRGLIVETDGRGGIVIRDLEDVACPLVTDSATRCFGADGYPMARADFRVGDMIEAIQDQMGDARVTRNVRVLCLAASVIPRAALPDALRKLGAKQKG